MAQATQASISVSVRDKRRRIAGGTIAGNEASKRSAGRWGGVRGIALEPVLKQENGGMRALASLGGKSLPPSNSDFSNRLLQGYLAF